MTTTDAIDDTIKSIVPVVGGVWVQYLRFADEVLTTTAHCLGVVAAGLVVVWWWRRIKKQTKDHSNK